MMGGAQPSLIFHHQGGSTLLRGQGLGDRGPRVSQSLDDPPLSCPKSLVADLRAFCPQSCRGFIQKLSGRCLCLPRFSEVTLELASLRGSRKLGLDSGQNSGVLGLPSFSAAPRLQLSGLGKTSKVCWDSEQNRVDQGAFA